MRGDGRIFKPKKSRFWHIAYYGPRPDGSLGEIRESARTDDERKARTLLRRRMAHVIANREKTVRRFAPTDYIPTSSKSSLAAAQGIAGNPIWRIDSTMFAQLVGPIVYAWVRGDEVLYVGVGASGIARPFRLSHHRALRACSDDGHLLIWTCPTPVAAYQLERELILQLAPRENLTVPRDV